MFSKVLIEKLEKIFLMKKTTMDAPSEDYEQDTLFIEIAEAKTTVSGSRIRCRVVGAVTVYSQVNKLPYGFFSKKIELAKPKDKAPFFFSEIDNDIASSPSRVQNIHERRTNFVFIYDGQFDPNKGKLTSLQLECSNG